MPVEDYLDLLIQIYIDLNIVVVVVGPVEMWKACYNPARQGQVSVGKLWKVEFKFSTYTHRM